MNTAILEASPQAAKPWTVLNIISQMKSTSGTPTGTSRQLSHSHQGMKKNLIRYIQYWERSQTVVLYNRSNILKYILNMRTVIFQRSGFHQVWGWPWAGNDGQAEQPSQAGQSIWKRRSLSWTAPPVTLILKKYCLCKRFCQIPLTFLFPV